MRGKAAVAVAALLLASACSSEGPPPGARTTGDPSSWRTDEAEPYPFVTPVPARSPTPVDGLYHRDYEHGSEPIPCRRCAPFRLDRGDSTLELREGRYYVIHELADFSTRGHYVVDGDRVELFNDPNCPETRGEYSWALDGDVLTLETIEDPCAFDLLRARYLSAAPWEA
jgi:hypothetical protein